VPAENADDAWAGLLTDGLGFGGASERPTPKLRDLQLRSTWQAAGGVHGCQSSVMTTLPVARPCSA
jgi:hypothetical protein